MTARVSAAAAVAAVVGSSPIPAQANRPSVSIAVAPNGRVVLFDSTASDLVPGRTPLP